MNMAMKIMFGDIAIYSQMYLGDSKFSAIYFVLFYIIMFFIMFAILIALIGGHYSHMMSADEEKHREYNSRLKFIIYCWKVYYNIKNSIQSKNKQPSSPNENPGDKMAESEERKVNEYINTENAISLPVDYPSYKCFDITQPQDIANIPAIGSLLEESNSFQQYILYLLELKMQNKIDSHSKATQIIKKEDISTKNIEEISKKNTELYFDEIHNRIKAATFLLHNNENQPKLNTEEFCNPNDNAPEAPINSTQEEQLTACIGLYKLIEKTAFTKIISIHTYYNPKIEENKECCCLLRYRDSAMRKEIVNNYLLQFGKVSDITSLISQGKGIDGLIQFWNAFNYEQYQSIYVGNREARLESSILYSTMVNSEEYKSIIGREISDTHKAFLSEIACSYIKVFYPFWSSLNPLCKTRIWNSYDFLDSDLKKVFEPDLKFENITSSMANHIQSAFKDDHIETQMKCPKKVLCKENLWKATDYATKIQMIIQERNHKEEAVMRALFVFTEVNDKNGGIEGLGSYILGYNAEAFFNLKQSALLMLNELYEKERISQAELDYENTNLKTIMDMATLAHYKAKKIQSKKL